MSEIRKDPILNKWVILDPERPVNFSLLNDILMESDGPDKSQDCPFCPGNESKTGKELLRYSFISGSKDSWDLRVIPNRIPSLRVEHTLEKEAEGIYDWLSGVGAHEVIIESPLHNDSYSTMSINSLEQIFWAYHDRIMDLKNDIRLEYFYFFKDFKKKNGISLDHPHSVLLATPFVPHHIQEEMTGAKTYFENKDRCIYCDIIRQEIKNGTRLIAMNESFVALCPYASRYPFEFWVLPVNHSAHFEASKKSDLYHLAEVISICFKKMEVVLGKVPYSMALHNSSSRMDSNGFYHWHFEIYPEIMCHSALVTGGDVNINPVLPEIAADRMRNEAIYE